ncbi:MAG: sigma-70 family RNA polymerase sigma factor [Acutalibacteraceae bacterium]|nr:sigma-70 family RNA polymerase sigma factor [Acutalibacteraceae bacterium]
MQNYTDEMLIKSAHAGDDNSKSELVRRYMSLVRLRAGAYTDKLLGFELDDLGQEGFIGLLCAINDYDENVGASFKTFATLCIDRKICDAVKKALRKKQIPQSAKVDLNEVANIGTPSAESEVIAKDELKRVYEMFDEVASVYEKQVFFLHLSGRSYKQIAQALSTSPKSVENALLRVRKKIKKD